MKRQSIRVLVAALCLITSSTLVSDTEAPTAAPSGGPLLTGSCSPKLRLGTKKLPVIAGKYSDTGADPFGVAALQSALQPQPGSQNPGLGEYYSEVSYGQFSIDVKVYGTPSGGLLTADADANWYVGPTNVHCQGECSSSHPGDYVRSILTKLEDNNPDFDWGQYDNDGPDGSPNSGDDDGVIDWIVIVFPTRDCSWFVNSTDPTRDNMRSRFDKLSFRGGVYTTRHQSARPDQSNFVVNQFNLCPLLSSDPDNTRITEIGVYAHELGHALGIHDLGVNPGPASWCCSPRSSIPQGVGFWDLMGWGAWGVIGDNTTFYCAVPGIAPGLPVGQIHPDKPTHMSAQTKAALGWLAPEVVSQLGHTSITLHAVEQYPEAVKVYPWGQSSQSEYFLIEYRKAAQSNSAYKFDRWLPGDGLAIWRVTNPDCFCDDGSLPCQPSGTDDIGLELVEAGCGSLMVGYGDGGDLFPGTNNVTFVDDNRDLCYKALRTYRDRATGITISEIQEQPDGSVTFDINIAPPPTATPTSPFTAMTFPLTQNVRGISLADVDKDGFIDLYLTKNASHANELDFGTGASFTLGLTPPLLANPFDGRSASFADLDNKGNLGLCIANQSADGLGNPSTIIFGTGCSTQSSCAFSAWPTSIKGMFRVATWSDYNRDGYVDLFLLGRDNFIYKSDTSKSKFTLDTATGITVPADFDVYDAVWGDYDGDRDDDLLLIGMTYGCPDCLPAAIAPVSKPPLFFRNNGPIATPRFSLASLGATIDNTPISAACWLDYNNDYSSTDNSNPTDDIGLDLFVGRDSPGGPSGDLYDLLFQNIGNGTLREVSSTTSKIQHLGKTSSVVPWDFDNDGNIDLFVMDYGLRTGGCPRSVLYRNTGQFIAGPVFVEIDANQPDGFHTTRQEADKVATADINNDGFVDLVLADPTAGVTPFINAYPEVSSNNWFQVALVGGGSTHSNRSAIGAEVEIVAGGKTQTRWISGGRAGAQDWSVASFGLGSSSTVDRLRVYWPRINPAGQPTYTEIQNLCANQRVYVNELPVHGVISTNTVWAGEVHLDGDVQVASGATLTIKPCTTIYAAANSSAYDVAGGINGKVDIVVEGQLQANGLPSQLITFRSTGSSENDWGSLSIISGASASISWAQIRHSQNGISAISSGTWAISNCTFDNNFVDVTVGGSTSSGLIDHCSFDVGYGDGVYLQSGTPSVTIQNSSFNGGAASVSGIHIAADNIAPIIDGNLLWGFTSIGDYSGYAIFLEKGNTILRENDIRRSRIGIYVTSGNPVIGQVNLGNQISGCTSGIYAKCIKNGGTCPSGCSLSVSARYNIITTNIDGVVADRTAAVDLGNSSINGMNDIYDNQSHCIVNLTNCGTVSAIGNYWNTGGCTQPTCKQGLVDTAHPLCASGSGGRCRNCLPPAMPISPGQVVETTPRRTALVGIHPNPFNPTTTVDFELKESTWTTISIYNVSGQLVRVESLGTQPAGQHNWVWRGTDQNGNSVSSGVYFVVLRAGAVTDRKKAVLLK
jgi:M6 family metalloprotease-like protein